VSQNRPSVMSPPDVARALVQALDELDAAKASLSIARPLPPVTRARAHVRSAGNLLDSALAGIVESWLRTTGDSARVEGELLAERFVA
jgi:hypothetical protein